MPSVKLISGWLRAVCQSKQNTLSLPKSFHSLRCWKEEDKKEYKVFTRLPATADLNLLSCPYGQPSGAPVPLKHSGQPALQSLSAPLPAAPRSSLLSLLRLCHMKMLEAFCVVNPPGNFNLLDHWALKSDLSRYSFLTQHFLSSLLQSVSYISGLRVSAGIQENSRARTCAVHGQGGARTSVLSCETVPGKGSG